jgi:hypothetical protein
MWPEQTFDHHGKLNRSARIGWNQFLSHRYAENPPQDPELLVDGCCFQSAKLDDSRFPPNTPFLLKARSKMKFDLRRVDLQKLAASKDRPKSLQGVLIRLVSFCCANRRAGIVRQEKIRPFVKCELFSLPQSGKGIVVSGVKARSKLLLRLTPVDCVC